MNPKSQAHHILYKIKGIQERSQSTFIACSKMTMGMILDKKDSKKPDQTYSGKQKETDKEKLLLENSVIYKSQDMSGSKACH